MTTSQLDYYQVLGLEPDATQEALKRRYRELARRYHPDINPSPDAAQKIKAINEAYHVLGDVDLRSTYDANRAFQSRSTPGPEAGGAAAASQGAPFAYPSDSNSNFNSGFNSNSSRSGADAPNQNGFGASARRPAQERSHVEHTFDGFGRVDPRADSGRAGASAGASPGADPNFRFPYGAGHTGGPAVSAEETRRAAARRRVENSAAEAKQLLDEAELEYINRQFAEAEELCRKVIALDRRNAVAYSLLGDACRKLGNTEAAIQAYSMAIQLNPRNTEVQANLDRLMGIERTVASGPKMARRRSGARPLLARVGRELVVNVVGGLAFAAVVSALLLLYRYPGTVWELDFSLNLLGVSIICGLGSGIAVATHGRMRPQSRELLMRSDSYSLIPFRGVLALLSMIWFGVSFIAYMLVAAAHKRLSHSVLRAYALTLILIVAVVALYHPYENGVRMGYSVLVAAFAGNLLFPAVMLGWHWGDRVRFRSYRDW